MNDLSWFLYLADTLPRFGQYAGFVALIIFLAGGMGMVVWTVSWLVDGFIRPPYIAYFSVFIVLSLISVVIPSKQTIYLIAGSEAGEAVVASEQGQEILNDIQLIIKQQLESMKGN